MVVVIMGTGFKMTFPVVAYLGFGLKNSMTYVMLAQFIPYHVLYSLDIFSSCNDMHGCVVAVAIYAPYMDMMDILNALYFQQMFSQLADIDVSRGFLQEQVQHSLQVLERINKNEESYTNAHEGVNHTDVGKVHDDGTYKDNYPAKYIFQHMQVHSLLVDGIALAGYIGSYEVEHHADNGEDDHATVVDLNWMEKPSDRPYDHQHRAHQQYGCGNHTAQDRVTYISICIFIISLLLALLLKKVGDTDGEGIPQVMQGI